MNDKVKVTGISCLYNYNIVEIPYREKDDYSVGDGVIFKDSEEKEEYGVIVYLDASPREEDQILYTSKILRKATANDVQKVERHLEQGTQALKTCENCVAQHGLEMFPFYCGYSFDGNRVFFMFTAEERVDFRDLVKDLAKVLQKQIHLRQVGPRDKAKVVGGYGKCGRKLCCGLFLGKLESINMEMVRVQGLESKGSSKLSGACGKLLCCLKYEVEMYKGLRKTLPGIGSIIKMKKNASSDEQEARVIGLDILNQKLKILTRKEEYMVIPVEEVEKVLKTPLEH